MSSLDSYQLLTLIFGVVVIGKVVTDYNKKADDLTPKLANFYNIITLGLPFLFAGYAFLISGATGESAYTYKMLVIGLSLASILLFITSGNGEAVTPASGASGGELWVGGPGAAFATPWKSVAGRTGLPLALGALFALPLVYFSMP